MSRQLQYLIQPVNTGLVQEIFQLWEWGFPTHGSNCLLSVLLLKWNKSRSNKFYRAEHLHQRDWAVAIEVEWVWLRRFDAWCNWVYCCHVTTF